LLKHVCLIFIKKTNSNDFETRLKKMSFSILIQFFVLCVICAVCVLGGTCGTLSTTPNAQLARCSCRETVAINLTTSARVVSLTNPLFISSNGTSDCGYWYQVDEEELIATPALVETGIRFCRQNGTRCNDTAVCYPPYLGDSCQFFDTVCDPANVRSFCTRPQNTCMKRCNTYIAGYCTLVPDSCATLVANAPIQSFTRNCTETERLYHCGDSSIASDCKWDILNQNISSCTCEGPRGMNNPIWPSSFNYSRKGCIDRSGITKPCSVTQRFRCGAFFYRDCRVRLLFYDGSTFNGNWSTLFVTDPSNPLYNLRTTSSLGSSVSERVECTCSSPHDATVRLVHSEFAANYYAGPNLYIYPRTVSDLKYYPPNGSAPNPAIAQRVTAQGVVPFWKSDLSCAVDYRARVGYHGYCPNNAVAQGTLWQHANTRKVTFAASQSGVNRAHEIIVLKGTGRGDRSNYNVVDRMLDRYGNYIGPNFGPDVSDYTRYYTDSLPTASYFPPQACNGVGQCENNVSSTIDPLTGTYVFQETCTQLDLTGLGLGIQTYCIGQYSIIPVPSLSAWLADADGFYGLLDTGSGIWEDIFQGFNGIRPYFGRPAAPNQCTGACGGNGGNSTFFRGFNCHVFTCGDVRGALNPSSSHREAICYRLANAIGDECAPVFVTSNNYRSPCFEQNIWLDPNLITRGPIFCGHGYFDFKQGECQCDSGWSFTNVDTQPFCEMYNCYTDPTFRDSTYNCSGHGTCINGPSCQCDIGWTGGDCSIPIRSFCNTSSCNGRGYCDSLTAQCICDVGE
jgi:hypothetical protein